MTVLDWWCNLETKIAKLKLAKTLSHHLCCCQKLDTAHFHSYYWGRIWNVPFSGDVYLKNFHVGSAQINCCNPLTIQNNVCSSTSMEMEEIICFKQVLPLYTVFKIVWAKLSVDTLQEQRKHHDHIQHIGEGY